MADNAKAAPPAPMRFVERPFREATVDVYCDHCHVMNWMEVVHGERLYRCGWCKTVYEPPAAIINWSPLPHSFPVTKRYYLDEETP